MLKEQMVKAFTDGGPGFRWILPERMRRVESTRLECED